jgi:hypothetical protein
MSQARKMSDWTRWKVYVQWLGVLHVRVAGGNQAGWNDYTHVLVPKPVVRKVVEARTKVLLELEPCYLAWKEPNYSSGAP